MADKFVRVRLLKISGVDLNVFEFDYDLTWSAFFMNASGKILARFGGRDGTSADSRNSLEALHHTMEAVLAEHKQNRNAKPIAPKGKPFLIEQVPAAKTYVRGGCIHCHQVKEILRQEAKNTGKWDRESIYTYPLPENVGLVLDLVQADLVQKVLPDTPASQAGLMAGDQIVALNGMSIHSFADASHALHKAPMQGKIPVSWRRSGSVQSGDLVLERGWRRTNVTWRPSLLDLLPSVTMYGDDLTAQEKKALGLSGKQLAFRQQAPVHKLAKEMGVRENDVILGVDGKSLEMSMDDFLGYVRRNYLIGEPITLNVLRNGKRQDLKTQLK